MLAFQILHFTSEIKKKSEIYLCVNSSKEETAIGREKTVYRENFQ